MRRLPFLSRADRRALLALQIVALLAVLGLAVHMRRRPAPRPRGEQGYATRPPRERREDTRPYSVPERKLRLVAFDPNTADSTCLLGLGLAPWQVRAIYRYRAKGGRYHEPDDFRSLPGMTPETWRRLLPYLRIGADFRYLPRQRRDNDSARLAAWRFDEGAAAADSSRRAPRDTVLHPVKLAAGLTVDVNTADTAQLKRVPGIGPYRARKVVEYRERLGGFVSREQAMEATELPDSSLGWLSLDTGRVAIRRVNINRLSVQRMMRHPYITFYQARSIWEYRRDHGDIRSVDKLLTLDHFSAADVERLRPYVEL